MAILHLIVTYGMSSEKSVVIQYTVTVYDMPVMELLIGLSLISRLDYTYAG